MPDDTPIAFTAEGRPIFDNSPSVVVVAAPVTIEGRRGLLGIRRGKGQGAGLLGLPGGFQMRGLSWQDNGVKEVLEETGHAVPRGLWLRGLVTDEYDHNVVLALSGAEAVQVTAETDGEAMEILALGPEHFDPEDWAFPIHLAHAILSWDQLFDAGMFPSRLMLDTPEDAEQVIARFLELRAEAEPGLDA